jgi:hypothetical protein
MQFFNKLPNTRMVRDEPVNWAQAKADLMQNPGQWGLMAENISSSTAAQLRSGMNRHFRGEELENFEFRVRKPQDPAKAYGSRRTDLYGRYSAPGQEAKN